MSLSDLSTFELSSLPKAENDDFEFKSSKTPITELKKKIACGVSGFANSGGGIFVAGVDENGYADGGFAEKIGNQDLRDWADQIIHQVEPTPFYEIKLLKDSKGRGSINPDCYVLVIAVSASYSGPHMAHDRRYYIRAGAHTVPARHFIVDAIWAKRHFSKPRLTHVFRPKPGIQDVIQLGIVSLTAAPAINVEIQLDPLGSMLKDQEKYFPLRIPLIDNDNPFFFDVTLWSGAVERFGNVQLRVSYKDLANNSYLYNTTLDVGHSTAPLLLGQDPLEKMARTLESIDRKLRK